MAVKNENKTEIGSLAESYRAAKTAVIVTALLTVGILSGQSDGGAFDKHAQIESAVRQEMKANPQLSETELTTQFTEAADGAEKLIALFALGTTACAVGVADSARRKLKVAQENIPS